MRDKTQEKQVMPNTIAHHPQTNGQLIPWQQLVPPGQLPPVYTLSMTFSAVEYPCGQFLSAVLAVLPPSFLFSSLAEHRKL